MRPSRRSNSFSLLPVDVSHAYRTLGLTPRASREEIKTAYRDLALVWHPDRFPAGSRLHEKAERNLKNINGAYALLKECRPPSNSALRRIRASLSAILGMGDAREAGVMRAPRSSFHNSVHVIGLEQIAASQRPSRTRWVIGVLVLIGVLWLLSTGHYRGLLTYFPWW
jgi:hypothetical protein